MIDVHFRGFGDYTEAKVVVREPVHVMVDSGTSAAEFSSSTSPPASTRSRPATAVR